jgi:hypothetical protein
MKLPQTDLEQKIWILVGLELINGLIIKTWKLNQYAEILLLIPLLSIGIFCFISHKKNWISKETKL